MNIIKSILGLSVINGMVGCATVDYIKPSDVSKFKNPAEVIVSKQLNGKDGTGKEYLTDTALLDHKIPFTYLKTFCESEPYRVCRRVNILRDYPDDKIKIYPRN